MNDKRRRRLRRLARRTRTALFAAHAWRQSL